ncbi:MAG: hypothetical protein LUF82_05800 [Clostridia bacterium]|nr:hypothetical protein [Clostridia bacterium]
MENKNTEKFGLLNLIRALSGQSEQSGEPYGQDGIAPMPDETSATTTENSGNIKADTYADSSGNTNIPADGGSERTNVLAGVIERHDKISNRLHKNKKM